MRFKVVKDFFKFKSFISFKAGIRKSSLEGIKKFFLKSVTQTFPNYNMSVFLHPIDICRNQNPSKERSIHWMSWESTSLWKSDGEMGFRSVRNFNVSLLGKQAWRLLVHPDKFVFRMFKDIYYS